MNGSLYDLKNRLLKLEDVSCQDDKFFEQLSSFMQDLNDEIEGGGIKCLHDFLLLDEIYSEFFDFMAELNSGPARCNIDNDMSELEDRIGWAKASLFAEVDIDTMKDIAWHEYAIDTYDRCYHDLLRESQKFKPSRRDGINEDIWAKMLENEENSLESSIDEGEYYDADYKEALLNMSRENELCLNITSAGCLYFALKSTNYIEAFHQALRLNILLSETFPDTLKPQFEAWLKGEEVPEPGQAQGEENQGKNFANEEKLVGDIKNCFIGYDNKKAEDLAREFLHKIKGMKKATDITDLVRDWRGKGWISPNSCGKPLFAPLHDAGIYKPKTVQNWNQQINNK